MSSTGKLRILCLHGCRQTGEVFRCRTGAFRKIFKKHVDFLFVTAPLSVKPLEETSEDVDAGRGWWFSREDNYYKAKDPSNCIKGYKESLEEIENFIQKEGPIDGILGFSQGAAMLGLICVLQQRKQLSYNFKFAIIVAGFRSRSEQHQEYYDDIIDIPTLHVFGHTDQVIEDTMSKELLQNFKDPVVIEHEGGHFVPASNLEKDKYLEFIIKMKENN